MKHRAALVLVALVAGALLAPFGRIGTLALPVAAAEPVETPILGEPVEVTPIWTAVPDNEAAPAPYEPTSTVAAGPSSPVTGGSSPHPTAALPVAAQPDRCEPNDRPEQPCPLPLDAVSGPFTFVPDDDPDFFRLDLPADPAIQTIISARATDRLDLVLSARQGSALLASGVVSFTLAPAISGTVLLRVENRDPRPAIAEQYRLEIRRELAPRAAVDEESPRPDELENNWGPATAAPIAVGVVYDLSFVCPEARQDACPGGDHDYLRVPVKAGVPYLLATWDLEPGVDTVVELFWTNEEQAVAANDDAGPGGMLSALRWSAPADGLLLVRIAPRNGGFSQHFHEANHAAYRFAIAPVASELAAKMEAAVRQQASLPTPTARPIQAALPPSGGGGAPAPAAGGSNPASTTETIAAGPAVIVAETVLRREPSQNATALATLAPEAVVSVRGPVRGLWVSVESEASILPGWVRFSDLRRVAPDATTPTTSAASGAAAGGGTPTPTSSPASSTPGLLSPTAAGGTPAGGEVPAVMVSRLDLALQPSDPAPAARVPFTVSVEVFASDRPAGGGTFGLSTPTPDRRLPVAGVRVQLVSVFGDLLAEGVTGAGGTVALSRDVRPSDALFVRVPAWGVLVPVAIDQPGLLFSIPEALQ